MTVEMMLRMVLSAGEAIGASRALNALVPGHPKALEGAELTRNAATVLGEVGGEEASAARALLDAAADSLVDEIAEALL